jgi:hypothetical protein
VIAEIFTVAFTVVACSAVLVGVAAFGVVGLISRTESGLRKVFERIAYGPKGSGETQIAALPKVNYTRLVEMERELGFEPLPSHVEKAMKEGNSSEVRVLESSERIKALDTKIKALQRIAAVQIKAHPQTREQFEEGCNDPGCGHWEDYDIKDGYGRVVHTFQQHSPHRPRFRGVS